MLETREREREAEFSEKGLLKMDSSEDVEVLSRAIEKLLDEKRKREAAGDAFIEDDDGHLLLTRLISQLKSSSERTRKTEETTKEDEEESSPSKGKRHLEENIEEIAKDIKKMKRQNTVIQVLLSAMILLTLTWQFSEYSMIFTMKDRLSHPIRSIGGMLSGIFKGKIPPIKNQLQGTSSTSKDQDNLNNGNNRTDTGSQLQMPELVREFSIFEDEDR